MSRIKVLVAEDEEHIAKLVEFKLSKDGCDVTLASDGERAVELLQNETWSLLILDVMMPVRDGWEVLKFCRGQEALKDIPILMLTAKGHQRDLASAAELGATQFLKKPFDPQELSDLVRGLLKT